MVREALSYTERLRIRKTGSWSREKEEEREREAAEGEVKGGKDVLSIGQRREQTEEQLREREEQRGREYRRGRVRKKAESKRDWGGESGVGVNGEQALVPVLIFTAKASSWSGTRRSVSSLATMPIM